jgi:ribonuclease J
VRLSELPPDRLHFLPLGGTGEIGMNLNAYHHDGRWLLVDAGVLFERIDPFRTRVVFPDVSVLEPLRDRILGLVITHIHQDHIGAVVDVWPRLRCPVYVTRFAAAFLDSALREARLHQKVPLRIIPEDARFTLGPFDLQRIPLTHSTVEMGALVIRTAGGTVLHTGDWKLDPDPVSGRPTDRAALEALAAETVHACVSDSTNALSEGWSGSEGALLAPLTELVAAQPGRVAVTLFSSNVARVRTLARVAQRTDRQLVFMGRSLMRTIRAAQEAGYLTDLPPVVDRREFGYLPRNAVLMLCTGSQGEPRAALTKMAEDARTDVYLEEGDTVIYSARHIPGCEVAIGRVRRLLHERGVVTLDESDAMVHVSGHPRRDELQALYRWVRPQAVVPVHGTGEHLAAHVALARELGMGAVELRNGDVVEISAPDRSAGPRCIGRVAAGRESRVEEQRLRFRRR